MSVFHAHPLSPSALAALDPGIRRTVAWLRDLGFSTTDSGDGVSKGEDGLAFAHVFIVPNTWSDLVQTARLLLWHLQGHAKIDVGPVGRGAVFIEASFDPFDGTAIVQLHGLDDAALVAAGVLPAPEEA